MYFALFTSVLSTGLICDAMKGIRTSDYGDCRMNCYNEHVINKITVVGYSTDKLKVLAKEAGE